jgi:hypothetical protein
MLFQHTRLALPVILLLAAAACDSPIAEPVIQDSAVSEQASLTSNDVRLFFNPQPDPPSTLDFRVAGPIDGLLYGEYARGGRSGDLAVETTAAVRRGTVLYVTQRWTVHAPEPVQPVVLELRGMVDGVSGRMILDGTSAAGHKARVTATVTSSGGGISIGVGELMFNPQPDPPKQR